MMNKSTWARTAIVLRESVFGDVARDRTARLIDLANVERPLAQALMHYDDRGACKGFSPIKFCSDRRGFALLSYGSDALAVVEAIAPQLCMAWALSTGHPVRSERQHGSNAIEHLPFTMRYVVPRLVVQKKERHLQAFSRDPSSHVQGLVRRSIERQCAFMGLKCPPIAVTGAAWSERNPVLLGRGGLALKTLRNVSFNLDARLAGWWSLGYLSAHGYGAMNADQQIAGIAANAFAARCNKEVIDVA